MLTIERQCELLGIPRSTYYYKPKPKGSAVDEMREAAMRAIDDIHLEIPFAAGAVACMRDAIEAHGAPP